MKLTDRKWMPFAMRDIFEIESGRDIYDAERLKGTTPYITSSAMNNGVTHFIANSNESLEANCISVNRNGSVGFAFYHQYAALYSNDCRKLRLRQHRSKHVSLFMTQVIMMQKSKYNYGVKMGTGRLMRQNIMLPVGANNKPDYAFMEAYIKEREKALLTRYSAFVKKSTIPHRGGVKPRRRVVWRPFRLLDYFDYKRGDQKDMNSLLPGSEMLVSARNVENGLKGFFLGKESHKRFSGDCLTLNNDGDGGVGLSYYQPHEFLLDTHVYALYPKTPLSRFAQLFMSRSISMCRPCFSHGHSISQGRLKTLKIMLPATDDSNPDFAYMDAYGREIMRQRLEKYLAYLSGL